MIPDKVSTSMRLTNCPSCQQAAIVPSVDDVSARVRCAYCNMEFAIEDLTGEEYPLWQVVMPMEKIVGDHGDSPPVDLVADVVAAEGINLDLASSRENKQNEPEPVDITVQQSHTSGNMVQDAVDIKLSPTADTTKVQGSVPSAGKISRRGTGRSPLMEMAKIFFGGILGLAIGYVILLILQGPGHDPLGIYDRLPSWLTDVPANTD